jgi:hypothetical protein
MLDHHAVTYFCRRAGQWSLPSICKAVSSEYDLPTSGECKSEIVRCSPKSILSNIFGMVFDANELGIKRRRTATPTHRGIKATAWDELQAPRLHNDKSSARIGRLNLSIFTKSFND